jgi:hypothetical protein
VAFTRLFFCKIISIYKGGELDYFFFLPAIHFRLSVFFSYSVVCLCFTVGYYISFLFRLRSEVVEHNLTVKVSICGVENAGSIPAAYPFP